jgi:hypothetical protein
VGVLRANHGSHRNVSRVYAYDPATETALVLWRARFDGTLSLGEVRLDELEALDKHGNYCDVKQAVAKRAGHILNREPTRAA